MDGRKAGSARADRVLHVILYTGAPWIDPAISLLFVVVVLWCHLGLVP